MTMPIITPSWFAGDMFGLPIPADAIALEEGGEVFLTEAFRAFGALDGDNRVTRITRLEPCPGGSTGRKLLLSVEYAKPGPDLQTDLFVKFSRDLDDPIRDRGRFQMELETRFAAIARVPDFPIAVPHSLFSDFHKVSGTGILITQRIAFGQDGIEPHHEKCLDYEVPDQRGHYAALLTAVARLAGAHKAGRLPAEIAEAFPFEIESLSVGQRAAYTGKQLQNRIARFADFAAKHPDLFPANIRAPAFLARLSDDAGRFPDLEPQLKAHLYGDADMIALCHWNANIDNAWFWHDADGALTCGLLDWGCASQMNLGMALWGSMSGAEAEIWNDHLEVLLVLFVTEFERYGGPPLDPGKLRRHLLMYVAMMGFAWLLDAPPYIKQQIPDFDSVQSRYDPRVRENEIARTQLQMLINFLTLWERYKIGDELASLGLATADAAAM